MTFFLKLPKTTPTNAAAVSNLNNESSSAGSFSIVCDIRNTTVYRIADIETLKTESQLSVTYYCLLTGLMVVESSSQSQLMNECKLDAVVVFEKETKTTSRDW